MPAVRNRDFLHAVYDALTRDPPSALEGHEWRIRWSLLQIFFADPKVHYEVWVQKKHRRIELGLHFECEHEESYRWAAALASRADEIMAQLGPDAELEEWTESWTRLHEVRTFEKDLTEELARETAERLARYIAVLQPVVEEERAPVRR